MKIKRFNENLEPFEFDWDEDEINKNEINRNELTDKIEHFYIRLDDDGMEEALDWENWEFKNDPELTSLVSKSKIMLNRIRTILNEYPQPYGL